MTAPNYLRTPNVPAHRAWNTWAADRYLEMSHLPLGVRVTPVVYAASIGKTIADRARARTCGSAAMSRMAA